MGAGGTAVGTTGPASDVSETRAPAAETGPHDAAAGGARFGDALDSARKSANPRAPASSSAAAPASGSAAAPASGSAAAPAHADTAARVRTTRPAARSRASTDATPTDAAPTVSSQEPAPLSAAPWLPASAPSSAAPSDAEADAVAALLLPGLAGGSKSSGSGTSAPGAAPAASSATDADSATDPPGATLSDPAGLLAMILGVAPAASGVAPAPSGAAVAGGSTVAALQGSSSGAGAPSGGATARAADQGAAASLDVPQLPGSATESTALVAQLAALPDNAASRPDGGDAQATQGAAAPSVQALNELVRGLTAPATPVSSAQQNILPAVGSTAWPGAVAAQVQWLASSGVSSATLHLSPEHLGPIQVFIDVQSSQVNVSFSAAHADTRAALEQALPKLREMFATGGLTLGQASVQQEARSGSGAAAHPRVTRVTDATATVAQPPPSQALGLVDEYA